MHLKYSFIKKTCKIVQKGASQIFLDPIQKRAPARSVQLEAVYLEALLYNRTFLKVIMLLHLKPNKVLWADHYKRRPVHFYHIFEDHSFVFFNNENWSMECSVISNLWVESSSLENLLPLLHTRSWSMKSWLNQE